MCYQGAWNAVIDWVVAIVVYPGCNSGNWIDVIPLSLVPCGNSRDVSGKEPEMMELYVGHKPP